MKKHPTEQGKARQLNLFVDDRSLFERLCDLHNLQAGFKAVKKNGGGPGVDGVTVEEYASRVDEELAQLKKDLEGWSYKPNPVRRVEIPKPGKGAGVRLLGVPCIGDRVVHATLKRLLEPILDPTFSDHSYGFRPGYNQQQAVEAAQGIVKAGKEYVIDIDLSKFFDRVNHDRLIHLLSGHVTDKRILRLIGMILRSGVMVNGVVQLTEEGTVQGSPLSPLLSNVVLDELDKELERRGLEFCRYADDCNIFVRSPKSANRVMTSISRFIEQKFKLKINRKKSKVGRSEEVKFLGMTIIDGATVISRQSMKRAMQKVKELIPRGTHLSLELTMQRINEWYMGWSGYYLMTQYPAQLADLPKQAKSFRDDRDKYIFLGQTKIKIDISQPKNDYAEIKSTKDIEEQINSIQVLDTTENRELCIKVLEEIIQSYMKLVEPSLENYGNYLPVFNYKDKKIDLRKPKTTYIEAAGSSSNDMFKHMFMFLGLHELMLTKNTKHGPPFLIIDQPSRPYYGEEENVSEARLQHSDRAKFIDAFKLLDSFIGSVLDDMKQSFQMIVFEHVPKDYFDDFDNIHLVEEFRDGNALVPQEYLDSLK